MQFPGRIFPFIFSVCSILSFGQSPKGLGVNAEYSFIRYSRLNVGLNYSVNPLKFNGNVCVFSNINFSYTDAFNPDYKFGTSVDLGVTTFLVGPSVKVNAGIYFPDRVSSNFEAGISLLHTVYVHYGYNFSDYYSSGRHYLSVGIKLNPVNIAFIQRQ